MPTPPEGPAPDHPDRNAARLTEVEAAAAFTDRTLEVMGEEVTRLHGAVRDLVKRLGRLEERLGELTARVERGGDDPEALPDIEVPPHSGGPDIPRDLR